jgi:hypothetical protein
MNIAAPVSARDRSRHDHGVAYGWLGQAPQPCGRKVGGDSRGPGNPSTGRVGAVRGSLPRRLSGPAWGRAVPIRPRQRGAGQRRRRCPALQAVLGSQRRTALGTVGKALVLCWRSCCFIIFHGSPVHKLRPNTALLGAVAITGRKPSGFSARSCTRFAPLHPVRTKSPATPPEVA